MNTQERIMSLESKLENIVDEFTYDFEQVFSESAKVEIALIEDEIQLLEEQLQ